MAEAQLQRVGREGGRWVNERPTSDGVMAWFEENVYVHEGLKHADYVNGITFIQNMEKSKAVGAVDSDGRPKIIDVEDLVWTPYMRIDTRVRYWNDLLEAHPEWYGTIDPVPVPRLDSEGVYNRNLPDGFFRQPVKVDANKTAHFIGISMQCRIWKREGLEVKTIHKRDGTIERVVHGDLVLDPAPATKMVNLLGRYGEDEDAVMKAETGAIGRALGMAGILVLGGGIATAEDVQESHANRFSSSTAPTDVDQSDLQAPIAASSVEEMRERAVGLIQAMEQDSPDKLNAFRAWVKERNFPTLQECNATQLKAVIRKLERGFA